MASYQLVATSPCPPTLNAPLLLPTCVEPIPFRSEEHTTPSGPPDEDTLATALPGSATHSHQMREPCRLFSRLAMTDGMDRSPGGPLVQLGWVTRKAGERDARAMGRQGDVALPPPRAVAVSAVVSVRARQRTRASARGRADRHPSRATRWTARSRQAAPRGARRRGRCGACRGGWRPDA
jgi:hypothetical protein